MNYKSLFRTAMLAGEIMAQSGAETYRVEDTMVRILKTSNCQAVEVYATTTGIVATLSDPSIESIAGVKRITNRSNNLSRINEVNQISRNICDGKTTAEDAYTQLISCTSSKIYSNRILALATIISMAGFAGLFGGSLLDGAVAAVNGIFIVIIARLAENRINNTFLVDTAKSFAIAFITMLSVQFIKDTHSGIIIIGSIMPLVPGIPITNAIRDTLQGDYNSGTARAVEAFVISLGIALGVGIGMGLFNLIERMLL